MYKYLILFALLCIGTAIDLISIPLVRTMLISSGLIRENYRGEKIPVSMGICFVPTILVNAIVLLYCNVNLEKKVDIFIFLFAVVSMSFVGVIDDILGNRKVTGLKGHFKALLRGRLTTGGFKAILGGIVGLVVSTSISDNIIGIIIGTLVVALSANFMNLFDLRPGRAIKVFFVIAIVIFIFTNINQKEIMALMLPAVWTYFYFDLKAKTMMGDSGSNLLGISIGVFIVEFYDIKIQICWLIFMIAIHLFAEKYSITKLIEKNKVLSFLDLLGR